VLINTAGYWDGLLTFLDRAVEAGFLKTENRQLLEVVRTAAEAVARVKKIADTDSE
jgi:predicted Rossmann-fold nucleotide-binding protein